jgi:cyclophilin family peptidyl-prolyl cis-trans isomerase
MKLRIYQSAIIAVVLLLATFTQAEETANQPSNQAMSEKIQVEMKTSLGDVILELDAVSAPITVKNFLKYVDEGFYSGTIFHRVIPGFMIQGGGFNAVMHQKKPGPPITNEANNGLKNLTGTIAMARTADVNSATSQFFINAADNAFLDNSPANFGYAVFGRVVAGQEVVRAIETAKTSSRPPFNDVPVETITIQSMQRLN